MLQFGFYLERLTKSKFRSPWDWFHLQWFCTSGLTNAVHILWPCALLRGPSSSVGKGWTGPGSHHSGGDIFRPNFSKCTGSIPRVKCGRGVLLTTYPRLVPRSLKIIEIYLYPTSRPHRAYGGITLVLSASNHKIFINGRQRSACCHLNCH